MVAVLRNHDIGWVSPAPLWDRFGDPAEAAGRERLARPAILRFAHDGFMDELLALLAYRPDHLDEWLARFETWERPQKTPPTAATLQITEPVARLNTRVARQAARANVAPRPAAPIAAGPPRLKLYQPVHQRYYLVTASLVCQRPGLPDRRVDAGRQEQAGFVLRRLLPAADATGAAATDPRLWREHAFIPSGTAGEWHPLGNDAQRLLAGEERLPLFGLAVQPDAGHPRQLLGGLIPVSRREVYANAAVRTAGGAGEGEQAAGGPDPRLLLLQMQATGPWSELATQAFDEIEHFAASATQPAAISGVFGSRPATPDAGILKRAREQIQTVSWYLLLDFARFLRDQVPRVWEVLGGTRPRGELDPLREEPLLARLDQFELLVSKAELVAGTGYSQAAVPDTLADALRKFAGNPTLESNLEAVDVTYDRANPDARWPGFLFPLAEVGRSSDVVPGAGKTGPFPFRVAGTDLSGAADRATITARVAGALAGLESLAEQALPDEPEAGMPEIVLPRAEGLDTREAWFTIRCVYERPNCGPREPTVLSLPTESFRMAGFFDPEAPARPLRIPMPLDITPAGLRKFNKNATLQISDALCGQLKRIRKLTLGDLVLSVLPWPFHKDLPNVSEPGGCKDSGGNPLGFLCSLSIPIVTLCALILLIIMVALFDLFFRWLPFLFLCLPVPGLKGKSS